MWRLQGAAAGLLLLLGLALAPPAAAAANSALWGAKGELSASKLFDFSYAGYRQGNADLPFPNVTRSVMDPEFTRGARSHTETFKRALAWAHAQPVTPGTYLVLYVPPGNYTLLERLYIERPWTVLRGAGSGASTLHFPKSLRDIYGPNPEDERGFYVNEEGFITLRGASRIGKELTKVTGTAKKGDTELTVASAAGIEAGDYVQTWWTDVGGRFNDAMFDGRYKAPAKYVGATRVAFTSKVTAVAGRVLTLERRLPYDIKAGVVTVAVNAPPDSLAEAGVEGLTFSFAWSPYNGHHLEKGNNAVFFKNATDSWARDIRTINADSSVLISGCTQITVTGLRIDVTATRANNAPNKYKERADSDGHWGAQAAHSFDVLVKDFRTSCSLLHDVGTGSSAKWLVFTQGAMKSGNLDLHRAMSGPSLYTDIDVGEGVDGLLSGGPPGSGPNAAAGTTWWNIRSAAAIKPPKSNANKTPCDFGPVINLVNVNLLRDKPKMCATWLYERSVTAPANLWLAQRAARGAPALST